MGVVRQILGLLVEVAMLTGYPVSPVTYLHLRMFEMALDYTKHKTEEFECLGGYMSPVNDFYKKAGLASSVHRCVLIYVGYRMLC